AAAWTRHLAGRARPPGRDRGPGAGAAPPRRNRAERDDLRPLLLPTSERALLRKGRRVALPDHRRYRRDRLMSKVISESRPARYRVEVVYEEQLGPKAWIAW